MSPFAAIVPKRENRNGVRRFWYCLNLNTGKKPTKADHIQISYIEHQLPDGGISMRNGADGLRVFNKADVLAGPYDLRATARAWKKLYVRQKQLRPTRYFQDQYDT